MLQTRSARPSRLLTLGAAGFAALHHWLVSTDPGLARLTLAGRGTLSVLLTTLAAILAGHLTGANPVEFAGGITLSLMGPFLMREPTRQARQRTLLTLLVPAALATIATALLHGRGVAGDSGFLVLVFVCFLMHPRGPRMIGVGLVAVVIAYVGLFLELPPATLPLQLASLLAAVPIIAFACFVALPMRPAMVLRRIVQAVQWRAGQVVHSARDVTEGRDASPAALALLRRDVARLNEATLAADDQLALMQPEGSLAVRSGLVDIELATARLIETLRVEKPGPRHAERLLLHERRLRRGQPYAMPEAALEPGSLLAQLVRLGHLVHALGVSASALRHAPPAPPGPALPPGPLAWRLATRVTLAAGLAMAGGMALSPQRWFWAVMTVYVVFLNARSRGDTILRGLQRLGGTVLGIASGLVLATLLTGDTLPQIAALLGAIFGMYYFFLVSYTLGIFCVTVMLGLLYGMLGAPLETVLLLRLEEAAIGAAAAIVVAAFVFPDSTTNRVRTAGQAVLAALAAALEATAHAANAANSPATTMRQVDRLVADLRLALAPMTATRAFTRRPAIERPVSALLDCVHWTRVVAAEAPASPDHVATLERAAHRLAALAGNHPPDPAPPPAEAPGPLAQLDRAITTMEQRRSLRAFDTYAIDS